MICAQHQNISPGITERTLALRALRQVSALFSPRPGRTRQFAASPFRSIAVIAGAARTSIALHSEATVFKIKEKLSGLLDCFGECQFLENAVHL